MTPEQLEDLAQLIDLPKNELRLYVGRDESKSSRLEETKGWTRGDLITRAIELGLTSISLNEAD